MRTALQETLPLGDTLSATGTVSDPEPTVHTQQVKVEPPIAGGRRLTEDMAVEEPPVPSEVLSPAPAPKKSAKRAARKERASKASYKISVKQRTKVLSYSSFIIANIEEALAYDHARHHNEREEPRLYINDDQYKRGIRNIAADLKKLTKALEAQQLEQSNIHKIVEALVAHANTLIGGFAKHMPLYVLTIMMISILQPWHASDGVIEAAVFAPLGGKVAKSILKGQMPPR